jgi:hypothetical protein
MRCSPAASKYLNDLFEKFSDTESSPKFNGFTFLTDLLLVSENFQDQLFFFEFNGGVVKLKFSPFFAFMVSDCDKALTFYQDVMGITLEQKGEGESRLKLGEVNLCVVNQPEAKRT